MRALASVLALRALPPAPRPIAADVLPWERVRRGPCFVSGGRGGQVPPFLRHLFLHGIRVVTLQDPLPLGLWGVDGGAPQDVPQVLLDERGALFYIKERDVFVPSVGCCVA